MSADGEYDKARVMERVRKLMALANDAGASEGERDNAMRMAHNTLAKYNLSMAEVERATGKKEEARGPADVKTRARPWIRHCMNAVAKLFFCEYFYMKDGSNEMRNFFIGRESNVLTAVQIATYVVDSIRKEGRTRQHALGAANGWYTSFVKGATMHVASRCDKLRAEAEQALRPASTGTALVLASVYQQEQDANAAFIKGMGLQLAIHKSREQLPGAGFEEGYEHGGKVGLTPQVGSKPQHKQLT